MTAWLLALALAAEPAPSALARATAQAAAQALAGISAPCAVGIWVDAPTPELSRAAGAALVDAVRSHGAKRATVLSGDAPAAESAARAQGFDVLLRVHVSLEGDALVLGGDRIGTWRNFWDGATPQPQTRSAVIAVRTAADDAVRTLARTALPVPPQPTLALQVVGRVPARIVALALVDADGDGHPEVAALTPSELLLLRVDGEVLARRDFTKLPERALRVRAPCGGLVSTSGGRGHRLLYAACNQALGEAVLVDGSGLHPIGLFDGVPLAQGRVGLVSGSRPAGTNLFGPKVEQGDAPRILSQPLFALAANPGAGEPAYLASRADGTVQALSNTLAPWGLAVPGGIAALADLDGDGTPELAISAAQPEGVSDHLRVVEPGASASRFEADVPGAITAATAGDLDRDGKEVALFAALQPDGTSALLELGVKP